MKINNFDKDFYLVNNPVIIELTEFGNNGPGNDKIFSVDLQVRNIDSGYVIDDIVYYINSESIKTDISGAAKAMLREPNFLDEPKKRNIANLRFKFSLKYIDTDTREITQKDEEAIYKTFIRGGYPYPRSNQNLDNGDILIDQNIRPIWDGFPNEVYYLESGEIKKTDDTPESMSEDKINKRTCDGSYIAFLNSLGGYSFWYFESNENKDTATDLDYTEKLESVKDLGYLHDEEITLISKVPKRFFPTIRSLIYSPDVYIYEDENWEKIVLKSNNLKVANQNKNVKVKVKAEKITRYNPSLIW